MLALLAAVPLRRRWGSTPAAPRLAVLPLDVDSADAQALTAADVRVEGVIAELARGGPERVRVLGPTTTRGLGTALTPVEPIRERLGVDFVLSGRLRVDGDTVEAFTQLIRNRDGVHVWAEAFRAPRHELRRVEREVARQTVGALAGSGGG